MKTLDKNSEALAQLLLAEGALDERVYQKMQGFYAQVPHQREQQGVYRHSPLYLGLLTLRELSGLRLDTNALQATLVYPLCVHGKIPNLLILRTFGRETLRMVLTLRRMAMLKFQGEQGQMVLGQSEEQEKKALNLILRLADDFRVLLLRIVHCAAMLRLALEEQDDAVQEQYAAELEAVYYPVAQRMGLGLLHSELGELLFRHRQPALYTQLAQQLQGFAEQHKTVLDEVRTTLGDSLKYNKINYDLQSRIKGIYSIWQKVQRKGIAPSKVYDIVALRVLVEHREECYRVLGLIHEFWQPIEGELDDYISRPKPNGYQSLHTAVRTEDGLPVEVQVRTRNMHTEAEYGICSHWAYKQGDIGLVQQGKPSQRLEWMQQLVQEYQRTGIMINLRDAMHGESEMPLYIYTPDGQVVELPAGGTALDFAYYIHEQVGHSAEAALVDGRRMLLDMPLKTGQVVEIVRGDRQLPQVAWLDVDKTWCVSGRARRAMRQIFSNQEHSGKNLKALEGEFEQIFVNLDANPKHLLEVSQDLGYDSVESMLMHYVKGEISMQSIMRVLDALMPVQGGELEIKVLMNYLGNVFKCVQDYPHLHEINMSDSGQVGVQRVRVGITAADNASIYRMLEDLLNSPGVQSVGCTLKKNNPPDAAKKQGVGQ